MQCKNLLVQYLLRHSASEVLRQHLRTLVTFLPGVAAAATVSKIPDLPLTSASMGGLPWSYNVPLLQGSCNIDISSLFKKKTSGISILSCTCLCDIIVGEQ
jgi:hypothetical protein